MTGIEKLIPVKRGMAESNILISIYSYAFEFHQTIAILNMLCRDGKKFAWNDGLKEIKKYCESDESYLYKYLMDELVEPITDDLVSTMRPLGLDRSLREDFVQLPSETEIKDQIKKRVLGEWSNNGSLKNQISIIIDKSRIREEGEVSYRIDDQDNYNLNSPV